MGADPWLWAWIAAVFALLLAVAIFLDRVGER